MGHGEGAGGRQVRTPSEEQWFIQQMVKRIGEEHFPTPETTAPQQVQPKPALQPTFWERYFYTRQLLQGFVLVYGGLAVVNHWMFHAPFDSFVNRVSAIVLGLILIVVAVAEAKGNLYRVPSLRESESKWWQEGR
jgi:hypothetical protein